MLTTKKQVIPCLFVLLAMWVLLCAGCRPSGPDLVREGKRLLDSGQPAAAIRQLRVATSVMPSNAVAWGYLGLAQHRAGAPAEAIAAYSKSVALNPNLAETRFDLGCVFLEQGDWVRAREQLAASTVLRDDWAMAWQCLGEAQVRLSTPDAAVRSLSQAVRLDPESADTWNWLGVAQLGTGQSREAARSFTEALRRRTNHGPALLNLAILNQTRLKQPAAAAELYRRYLAFHPNVANATEIRTLIEQLTQPPQPGRQTETVAAKSTPAPVRSSVPPTHIAQAAEPPAGSRANPVQTPPQRRAEPTPSAAPSGPVETIRVPPPAPAQEAADIPNLNDPGRSPQASRQTAMEASRPLSGGEPDTAMDRSANPQVASQPFPGGIQSEPGASVASPSVAVDDNTDSFPASADVSSAQSAESDKRGFFARLNPLNLVKRKPRQKETTPLPPARNGEGSAAGRPAGAGKTSRDAGQAVAEREYERGELLRKSGRFSEAIQAYRGAIQSDPSHFGAYFQLGVVYLETGNLPQALDACEKATVLQPNSTAARYNYALALKAAGQPAAAVNELLIVLQQDPTEVRAHLTLGNLYARQYGDPAKARVHYRRVLELDPGHPQAASIHQWLAQNPL